MTSVNALNVIFEGEEKFEDVINKPLRNNKNNGTLEEKLKGMDFENLSEALAKDLKDLLIHHKKLFEGPIRMANVRQHKIELIDDAVRTKPHKYKIPELYEEEVDRQIGDQLKLGLIEETDAEIMYPIVGVSKKDTTIRMCVDFRSLNKVSKSSSFPVKNAQDLLLQVGKTR